MGGILPLITSFLIMTMGRKGIRSGWRMDGRDLIFQLSDMLSLAFPFIFLNGCSQSGLREWCLFGRRRRGFLFIFNILDATASLLTDYYRPACSKPPKYYKTTLSFIQNSNSSNNNKDSKIRKRWWRACVHDQNPDPLSFNIHLLSTLQQPFNDTIQLITSY